MKVKEYIHTIRIQLRVQNLGVANDANRFSARLVNSTTAILPDPNAPNGLSL
jgi:hypothetical protein